MEWFLFSLTSAFCIGVSDAVSKPLLRHHDALTIAWVRNIFIVLFLIPFVAAFGVYHVQPGFWPILLFIIPCDMVGIILYLRAIQLAPLSLTLPFLAFTPVFAVFTSWLFLGEKIRLPGLLGIFLITLGCYLLNVDKVKRGIAEPFYAIWREPGSRLMLFVAALFSFNAIIGKKVTLLSSPRTMVSIYPFLFMVALSIFYFSRRNFKERIARVRQKDIFIVAISGVLVAVSIMSHFKAISLIEAAYMLSIKRLSILFGVLWGFLFFREKHILNRLPATVLMLAGVIIISLY